MHNILGFLNFQYLSQIIKRVFLILTILEFIEKIFIIILSFLLYALGENKLVESNELLPFSINSTNLIQKYTKYYQIVKLYSENISCDILVVIFLYILWNMFNFEAMKGCYNVTLQLQSY